MPLAQPADELKPDMFHLVLCTVTHSWVHIFVSFLFIFTGMLLHHRSASLRLNKLNITFHRNYTISFDTADISNSFLLLMNVWINLD